MYDENGIWIGDDEGANYYDYDYSNTVAVDDTSGINGLDLPDIGVDNTGGAGTNVNQNIATADDSSPSGYRDINGNPVNYDGTSYVPGTPSGPDNSVTADDSSPSGYRNANGDPVNHDGTPYVSGTGSGPTNKGQTIGANLDPITGKILSAAEIAAKKAVTAKTGTTGTTNKPVVPTGKAPDASIGDLARKAVSGNISVEDITNYIQKNPLTAAAGIAALTQAFSSGQTGGGYTGAVPNLTASRARVNYSPVGKTPEQLALMAQRRPGSMGRSYFGDVQYAGQRNNLGNTAPAPTGIAKYITPTNLALAGLGGLAYANKDSIGDLIKGAIGAGAGANPNSPAGAVSADADALAKAAAAAALAKNTGSINDGTAVGDTGGADDTGGAGTNVNQGDDTRYKTDDATGGAGTNVNQGEYPLYTPPTETQAETDAKYKVSDPVADASIDAQPFIDSVTEGHAQGGIMNLAHGRYLRGGTDGMADKIPSSIDNKQPAKLSHGEFVIPADVVSHLGNGNSDAGANKLYQMMDKIRKARTGTKRQGKQINPDKFMPGGIAGYAGGGGVQGFAGPTGSAVSNTPGTAASALPAAGGSSSSTLSPYAGDYVTNMLGKGQALAEMPYQTYEGPLTAGASDLQNKAFTGLQNTNFPSTLGQSFTNTGAPTAGTGGQPMGGSGIAAQYMNPYLQNVLNPQLDEMRRQSQITQMGNAGRLTQAGAYGGSRQAIMDAETQRNMAMEQNKAIGTGYASAYDKGMGQFNTEQQQGMGLAGLMAGQGAAQRGIEAEGIAADKAQFEEQRDNPYKMVQYQQGLLQGLPISTVTNTPSQMSGLGGLSSTIGSLGTLMDSLKRFGLVSDTATTPPK